MGCLAYIYIYKIGQNGGFVGKIGLFVEFILTECVAVLLLQSLIEGVFGC